MQTRQKSLSTKKSIYARYIDPIIERVEDINSSWTAA